MIQLPFELWPINPDRIGSKIEFDCLKDQAGSHLGFLLADGLRFYR